MAVEVEAKKVPGGSEGNARAELPGAMLREKSSGEVPAGHHLFTLCAEPPTGHQR